MCIMATMSVQSYSSWVSVHRGCCATLSVTKSSSSRRTSLTVKPLRGFNAISLDDVGSAFVPSLLWYGRHATHDVSTRRIAGTMRHWVSRTNDGTVTSTGSVNRPVESRSALAHRQHFEWYRYKTISARSVAVS